MVRRFPLACFAAAAVILTMNPVALGQGRSTGGAGGGLGSTASGFGGSSFGASSFGSSSFGGSSFGQSGFGSGGTSSFGSGTTSSTTSGTTTFVGRGAETAFVGRGAGLQQLNVSAGQTQRSSRGGRSESSSSEATRPTVRVRLTPSPELLARSTRVRPRTPNVGGRLVRGGLDGVSVAMVDGVTRLDGSVATASERLLAEKLLAIEPGVGRIDNRLRIESTPPEVVPVPR